MKKMAELPIALEITEIEFQMNDCDNTWWTAFNSKIDENITEGTLAATTVL